ncbi:MAG: DUF805 domain-containing protein [Alphaproteobacteria bacterium]|nr:DUF805 domain-containing protein [Alphaproteobacteria bacterium]
MALNKIITAYKKAVFENYANFKGRSPVGDYWWFFLGNFILSLGFSVVDNLTARLLGFVIFGTIYSLAVLVPGIAAGVRRLHDMGKCGWWLLAPIYNIYLLIQSSQSGKNDYGDEVK